MHNVSGSSSGSGSGSGSGTTTVQTPVSVPVPLPLLPPPPHAQHRQPCLLLYQRTHNRTRDDTVRCIVASLTDDSSNELADVSTTTVCIKKSPYIK